MDASRYRPLLAPITLNHLKECCVAYEQGEHFAAAVWGAVFLEAFLSDLSTELEFPNRGQDDLNGRIQRLQQYQKNHSPQKPDVPDEVVKRCDEIRSIRNRLVHHCGLSSNTVAQDAQFLLAGIEVILEWYQRVKGADEAEQMPDGASTTQSGVPIFVSTVTPHNQRQTHFLDTLMQHLRDVGGWPKRMKPTIFDRNDPIGAVRRQIEECRAVVVVGLERSHAYFLRDKEGTKDEFEDTHRKYTSGWLHLEAGIANALGLPVFVICEAEICSDGIFDRGWNTYAVTEVEKLDEDSPALTEFIAHVGKWAAAQDPTTQ